MVRAHDLVVTGNELVKRYSSWARGEHGREWLVLTALHGALSDDPLDALESALRALWSVPTDGLPRDPRGAADLQAARLLSLRA
ncbi:hypothetical protein ACIQMJ_16360 [Actinosynnema sp. NPDC091369]